MGHSRKGHEKKGVVESLGDDELLEPSQDISESLAHDADEAQADEASKSANSCATVDNGEGGVATQQPLSTLQLHGDVSQQKIHDTDLNTSK